MRGWTPLFAVAALLTATAARAQPSLEPDDPPPTTTQEAAPQSQSQSQPQPQPQPQPQSQSQSQSQPMQPQQPAQQQQATQQLDDDEPRPAPVQLVPTYFAPPPAECCRPRERHLLLKLSVGATYRRAFGDDFFAAMPELEIGGQTSRFSIGARVNAALGATRDGLPFQFVSFGPNLMFRQSSRVMLGVGLSMGFFMYERASVTKYTDPLVWSPSFGLTLSGTVDLVRSAGGGALYADLRVMIDEVATLHGGFADGLGIAPVVSLGWRL